MVLPALAPSCLVNQCKNPELAQKPLDHRGRPEWRGLNERNGASHRCLFLKRREKPAASAVPLTVNALRLFSAITRPPMPVPKKTV